MTNNNNSMGDSHNTKKIMTTAVRAKRRLKLLGRALAVDNGFGSEAGSSEESECEEAGLMIQGVDGKISDKTSIRIGDVSITILPPDSPFLVPEFDAPLYDDSQETLRHLRWMMQKDKLGQDIFLIGPPSNLRRGLVLKYAQLTKREIEYIPLSKDLTDGDIKQRRELSSGTSSYVDQPAVRAALLGRLLILDGIEKAERNVLPILNNLLENREMALDDGRFLVSPKRYDELARTEGESKLREWKLEKVHERFRVIALGLPVPPYPGHPLDPPLRSRFQSRDIKVPGFDSLVRQFLQLAPKADRDLAERIASAALVLGVSNSSDPSTNSISTTSAVEVPEFPMSIDGPARVAMNFPLARPRYLMDSFYPWPLLSTCDDEQRQVIESVYNRFGLLDPDSYPRYDESTGQTIFPHSSSGYILTQCQPIPEILNTVDQRHRIHRAAAVFREEGRESLPQSVPVVVPLHTGPLSLTSWPFFVETPYHRQILTSMYIAHSVADFCLLGPKGVGKSALVREFARSLGYNVQYIPLYRDMSARDFLQRRSTTFTGDTVWENSSLVEAAIRGHLAVLDGIETLAFGTLSTLQRLVHEREATLPDGRQLVHWQRYRHLLERQGLSREYLWKAGLIPVHPSFRIICLARPHGPGGGTSGEGKSGSWLSAETVSMFHFVVVKPLGFQEERYLLESLSPGVSPAKLAALLSFANRIRRDQDDTIRALSSSLSTRQLVRICRRLAYSPRESLHAAIHKVSLSRFLPSIAKEALEILLKESGIQPEFDDEKDNLIIEVLPSREKPEFVRIGGVEEPVATGSNPLLIPDILFHENPKQTEILREMLKDFQLGEALLLIGNQGVGKNKLADYFLQLLRLPREYIQLHRDSTVQSLTASPAVKDGVLVWEDSPLVKAVRDGSILVVDEADKAPTYVTAVLKSLLDDGEMVLSDGRRIIAKPPEEPAENIIIMHKNFRMIVLANRPGYPFLGNDFYREIGDVFACHAVDNPSSESEMYLLRKYAPDLPEELLLKLSAAFSDLRRLVDEGLLSYPYSTRELVNIVRHMQMYPEEGVSRILQNIFDFDQYDRMSKDLLIEAFQKHGIPIGLESDFTIRLGTAVELPPPVVTEVWARLPNRPVHESKADEMPLVFRGGWDLNAGKNWRDLERVEGRSVTFTEQLYSFNIPTRGEALDVVAFDDGSLFVVTTNPVTLHHIERGHHKVNSIDLYEFFPLQKTPPRLRLATVKISNATFLVLHNPSNNELLSCDLVKNSIVSIVLKGLDPVQSIMVNSLGNEGILVFYQAQHSTIAVIDFNNNMQFNIRIPVRVTQLFIIERGLWILRDANKRQYHVLRSSKDSWLPTVFETIDAIALQNQDLADIIHVSDMESQWSARGAAGRFISTEGEDNFVSVLMNLGQSFLKAEKPSQVEMYSFKRPKHEDVRNMYSNLKSNSMFLRHSNQYATIIPFRDGRSDGFLELVNLEQNHIWRMIIPLAIPLASKLKRDAPLVGYNIQTIDRVIASLCELPNGSLLTMDNSGQVRVWQVNSRELFKDAQTWKRMVGVDQKVLSIIYGKSEDELALDVGSSNNEEGGNGQGQGSGSGGGFGQGSGGGSGSGEGGNGEGGSGGGGGGENLDGREASFVDVSSLQLRTEARPTNISDAQREMHEMTMQKRLEQINMTQADAKAYADYYNNVQREIRELRVILESLEAKNKERVWLKNQSSGDIDDTKLVEGLTGERAIYKRRGEDDPEPGFFQDKPKRMYFVFDLSASMYRFNTHDRRLERSLEVALMIMESFKGFEHKFSYRILGHSGDGPSIEFVKEGKYPNTEKDLFKIISKMQNHAQFCLSGDNTVAAAGYAMKEIIKEEGDDYFVVILSDANIGQYNIRPADLTRILKSDERITASMIFIGTLQDQADVLKKEMGSIAHVCLDNKDLPKIMKALFLSSMLKM